MFDKGISIFAFSKNLSVCSLVLWGGIFLLGACSPDEERKFIPDVSDINVDVSFRRFEQDLFSLDTTDLEAGLENLLEKYPEFSEVYFSQILRVTGPKGNLSGISPFVQGFLKHPSTVHLYDTCMTLYQDLSEQEQDLEQAFRFLKYYFPGMPIPDVTTFISEYGVGSFIYGDQSLAVGLDFFLGSDYPYAAYNPGNANFSDYLTRTFNRDHLVFKTLLPLVEDLVGEPEGSRLLDLMIHNGKKMYIMDQLLPLAPDSVKWEVTADQAEWLKSNELEMWAYFLQEDLLYSSKWLEITKYVNYSPRSPGMPPEAPGRTANWLGWQIVKAYMKKYPEQNLQDLIERKNAQQLMDLSKYKPRRRK